MKSNSMAGKASCGEGGAVPHDVVGGLAFAFEQQVGLADGVGFGVDLLAEQVDGDLLAVLLGRAACSVSSATVSMPPVPQAPS